MKALHFYHTPIGLLRAKVENGFLTELCVTERIDFTENRDVSVFENLQQALNAYFTGDDRKLREIPIRMQGSAFQRQVWEALRAVPFGETRTYGEIADVIGKPGSARAVGGACHRNPILLCIPCHRVIGSGGHLTGFGAGMENKIRLLQHEHHIIEKESIIK